MTTNQHAEAFCLMTYESDDGSESEVIWNSRDGVTPFVIRLRSGKEARHVRWEQDRANPDFTPPVGSRVFIDMDESRASALASAKVEAGWDHPEYPASAMYESREEFHAALLRDLTATPGQPVLIEVREPWTGGELIEAGD